MAFTAQDVKALREKTGVGMMECKKALTEADGDMDKAVEILRERGLAAAQKKAARIAAEGVVLSYSDPELKKGVVIEVNSETDFVAKNEKFIDFVTNCAKVVLKTGVTTVEELAEAEYADGRTVTQALNDLILAIGENMKIRRFETMQGTVATYVHGGGSVGVMVGFDVADESAANASEFDEMGKNIAMQIAAMSPAYLDEASVPASVIEYEKGILAAQMKEDPKMASKPEAVLQKIAAGKMGKYYKENCLVEQEFVRSDLFQGSVKGYIDSVAKSLGTEIKANGFIRMTRGEGIEKKKENFAEEIAKQIKG
ncbi:MAG: translation elongation factor Ts [Clostridiales bacterium]|nr:translation elongation factor Ts [Clostridiales bacterium]